MFKAFLLGAGLGTRLRPMTETTPKPLVPVFHRPLAMHALDHLGGAGIQEVAINTHHLAAEWQTAFPEKSYQGIKLHFFHEENLLETGGGIKNIASFIGSESVLVYNGDILTDIRIDKLITGHFTSNNTATLAVRSDGPARHLAVTGRKVVDIHRKLDVADGTHQFTGIYCIDPEILALIPNNEKVSIIPTFLELAKANKLGAYQADEGHWLDLGTRELYLETHGIGAEPVPGQDIAKIHPEAVVDPSALVENSWVGPRCHIGADASIKNSVLWADTRISAGSALEQCIVHTRNEVVGTYEKADL